MNFSIASAILRGRWLLDKDWVAAHMPLVMRMMKGESVDFKFGKTKAYNDDDFDDEKPTKPVLIFTGTGAAARNIYAVRPYSSVNDLPDGSIVMVTLAGPVTKRGGMCSYGMVDQAALMNRLAMASNVAGVIIDADSPGGQVDGTATLADSIGNLKSKKPVLGMIDDGMAASAMVWILSPSTEIYATQKTVQVGSVGVYTTIADWKAYYASEGIPIKDIYAPQSTDKNKGYRDAFEKNDDSIIEEELSVIADQFINTVATNRAGKIKGDSWKTGKMFYATDAIKIGLIDGIKSFDQVVARMNSLISTNNKSKSNNMSFQKTLGAAKASAFAVTDEGFVLSEEHLNNVEAALANTEAAEKNAADLKIANVKIGELTASLTTAGEAATTASSTITRLTAELEEVKAENKELGGKASGKGTTLKIAKDVSTESTDNAEKHVRFDDANHPANVAAANSKGYQGRPRN